MKNAILFSLTAVSVGTAVAAVHEFNGAELRFSAEPAEYRKLVSVSQTVDGVWIDAAAAFKAGMRNLVCEGPMSPTPELAGKLVGLESEAMGPCGTPVKMWVRGNRVGMDGRKGFYACPAGDFRLASPLKPSRFRGMVTLDPAIADWTIRFDLGASAAPVFLGRFRFGTADKIFTGNVSCASAGKRSADVTYSLDALEAGKVERIASDGVFDRDRGAICGWFRLRHPAKTQWAFMVSGDADFHRRFGTGSPYVWIWSGGLRFDRGDPNDRYLHVPFPMDDGWHFFAVGWDGKESMLFVDGNTPSAGDRAYRLGDCFTETVPDLMLDGPETKHLTFGGKSVNCDLKNVRVWSGMLSQERVRSLYVNERGETASVDYGKLFDAEGANPYEGQPVDKAGIYPKGALVHEIRFDTVKPAEKFAHVGDVALRELNGVKYLETGLKKRSRFAVGFDVDPAKAYVVELDYPDDKVRTMDFILQDALNPANDYLMQVGVACGGEFPNTGRIMTHRVLFRPRAKSVAAILMAARGDVPAAASALRVYELGDGRLPVAAVREPAPGMGRWFGTYYEDAAFAYDYVDVKEVLTPAGAVKHFDRLAAQMKFNGENLFTTPRYFYNGRLDGAYNPRGYAPDFFKALYEKFDREGLFFMPMMNWTRFLPEPEERVSPRGIVTGAFNSSVYTVPESGMPSVRQRAPQMCFAHPAVRKRLSDALAFMTEEGRGHRSFKGIVIHLTSWGMAWLGSEEGPFNDYAVEQFERYAGLKVPVDMSDPMRGRVRARWIKANALEKWRAWRRDLVTGFWIDEAKKLAERVPGARLALCNYYIIDPWLETFENEDFNADAMREFGLDLDRLRREAPEISLVQTTIPADYRFGGSGGHNWGGTYYRTPERRDYQRTMHLKPRFWDFAKASGFPWAHQHDRYYEDDCGLRHGNPPGKPIVCDWLKETTWRVSTINPSGRHALAHYAQALRFGDKLALTKGGFLVGTYGMEECLAPFAQAFRALPAVMMDEVKTASSGDIVVRRCAFGGRTYFYAVNTGSAPAKTHSPLDDASTDLVTGARIAGRGEIALDAYELRSFVK